MSLLSIYHNCGFPICTFPANFLIRIKDQFTITICQEIRVLFSTRMISCQLKLILLSCHFHRIRIFLGLIICDNKQSQLRFYCLFLFSFIIIQYKIINQILLMFLCIQIPSKYLTNAVMNRYQKAWQISMKNYFKAYSFSHSAYMTRS